MCFCCCVLTGELEMTSCSSAELLLVFYVAVSPREDVFLFIFLLLSPGHCRK